MAGNKYITSALWSCTHLLCLLIFTVDISPHFMTFRGYKIKEHELRWTELVPADLPSLWVLYLKEHELRWTELVPADLPSLWVLYLKEHELRWTDLVPADLPSLWVLYLKEHEFRWTELVPDDLPEVSNKH